MNTKSKLKIRKKSPKSNDDIFPEITSSDRRNIRKVREYEHKFFKSSDNGKWISPKASIKKEKFSDYVKTNTGYYNGSMSPVIQKQKEFSPILKRKRSNVVFDSIDLFQVFDKYQKSNGGNTFKNKDEKEYIALTGKTIEFL